jgi:hypothetical protein
MFGAFWILELRAQNNLQKKSLTKHTSKSNDLPLTVSYTPAKKGDGFMICVSKFVRFNAKPTVDIWLGTQITIC